MHIDPLPHRHLALRDGRPILIRPLLPADRPRLEEGARRLSPASFHARFHTAAMTLTEAQFRYFTDVDQWSHVALCAIDLSRQDANGLGTGRFIRLDEPPASAELALTVLDDHQRMGLGSALLACLCERALAQDLRTFVMHIQAGRRDLIRAVHALGARTVALADGVVQIHLPIGGAYRRLRSAMEPRG